MPSRVPETRFKVSTHPQPKTDEPNTGTILLPILALFLGGLIKESRKYQWTEGYVVNPNLRCRQDSITNDSLSCSLSFTRKDRESPAGFPQPQAVVDTKDDGAVNYSILKNIASYRDLDSSLELSRSIKEKDLMVYTSGSAPPGSPPFCSRVRTK